MDHDRQTTTLNVSPRRLIWLVLLGVVVAADVLIYRSHGYAGPAVFFPLVTVILLGARSLSAKTTTGSSRVVGMLFGLLLLLSVRMIWAGNGGQILAATWLMTAVMMAAQGLAPYLLESLIYAAGLVPGGYEFFHSIQLGWRHTVLDSVDHRKPSHALSVLLPAVSALVFATVFALANPDVIRSISTVFADLSEQLHLWLKHFTAGEVIFWCAVFWLTGGLLRPVVSRVAEIVQPQSADEQEHGLYGPFRNTLATLILLFGAYLIFEFRTLWFRSFPTGFHYSGYAHEGAAWLTVALALATLMLSLIFRGTMFQDTRVLNLQRLAWAWSALNLLLAASVYNRMLIYINFNGMTQMRVVGLLGISAVVGGFGLVLWKIRQRHNFGWLIRRQLWVLAFAVYLLLLLPVDILVCRYNVQRILAGSPAPCVQITQHDIGDDALPQLLPLLNCKDTIIIEGVRAMLRMRLQNLKPAATTETPHWTATQIGRRWATNKLLDQESRLQQFSLPESPAESLRRFHEYSMQWW